MDLFGMQIPETVEIYGVAFLVNPVTILIAAFPLIFALALTTYLLTQRRTAKATYKHAYDFYTDGPIPRGYNAAMLNNSGQALAPPSQVDMIDIGDEVTDAVKVPAFYTSAPAYLIYISGGQHLPRKLPLDGSAPIHIGRKKSYCELVLDDKRVSRLHAVVSRTDDDFFIVDEGSAGGTFVNRQKLGSTDIWKLAHNDIINFNEAEYRFEITYKMEEHDNAPPSASPLESVGG